MKYLLLIIALLSGINSWSQKNTQQKALHSRSDTIDILNYEINLDFTDFSNKTLKGNCIIKFTPKMNGVNSIGLDLLKLNIDSITSQNTALTYSYNDTLLTANLPNTLNQTDTSLITIYYNGSPQKDASGWGGFYFDATYAFNLGVGFDANPHNYGRVWFPCFDNFVERSTYHFNIITSGGKNAHCNGYLDTTYTIINDTIMNSWVMNEEIPTYLVCVAIADYQTVHQLFTGISKNIPVELVAREPDTTALKNSFINLESALNTYENAYGPYLWNKIGFSLVPFSSGAMEHATNIAYPKYAANGTLTSETLMAHEFAHHWWGDLVTCETAEDMWINEGMASYSEHLFLEKVYDYNTSLMEIKRNHKKVLQFTHINEGGYRAISGVPHEYTYGEHVYDKGASVAHNMRAYLGDSLFFVGLKAITNNYKYKNINSAQFRDELTNSTLFDMTNFFNDWVFSPGFSHFAIDSIQTSPNGGDFDVTLFINQKLRGTTNYHTGTPLEITFYDANWNKITTSIIASGQYSNHIVTIPFSPTLALLNEDNKLNQARTDDNLILKNITSKNLEFSLVNNFNVSSISDSALLYIEHHWVAPDTIKNNTNNYRISTNRYWSFDGILPTNFSASARLNYDSRSSNGYLDNDLLAINGDSLILLYRKDAHSDWKEYNYYTKTSITNAFGFIDINNLSLGQYTFANGISTIGINKNDNASNNQFEIYPNPAKSFIWIKNLNSNENVKVIIYDITGKEIYKETFSEKTRINTSKWNKKGTYIITILKNEKLVYNKKIIIT
ncbi:MAG: T9SS type A sorting domain-containing protein [Vicingus serpentipes]|nr:T9SS type A sorting domain-containing protein [Vicingus serpentipes]